MIKRWPIALWQSLSGAGLILGTLLFAASLTPTLVPRTYIMQGVLAGGAFAIGYGLGVLWRWLWHYLELPSPRGHLLRLANGAIAVLCLVIAAVFLWRTADWQNGIRTLMGLDPLESSHRLKVCALAVVTFLAVLALSRLFLAVIRLVARRLHRYVPQRVANVIGIGAAVLLFWSLATDVVIRFGLQAADSSFREWDALFEPLRPQPASPLKAGGAGSLLRWHELGRTGRAFVASGPSAQDITAVSGRPAQDPIRVYVGLRSAPTPEQRARLALDELKRVDAFKRAALIVVTPTGTGWVDPSAMDSVEYLHDGDIASVAMQYSYLSSPLSLLVQPDYGSEAARALFAEVYAYWRTLPRDARPKLYLHGLSLGAMNSEQSAQLFEILADPIHGALWSGPPFESRIWRRATDARVPGSPAWLPLFRDGSLIRFMNQNGAPTQTGTGWGPMRIVYLQYASDAITFFDYRDLYRRPAWMDAPRGPDVSPELRWVPLVTMLQLALDMPLSMRAPMGYGHVYAPAHYLDGWLTLTEVTTWSPEAITRLKEHLARASAAASTAPADDEQPYANRGG